MTKAMRLYPRWEPSRDPCDHERPRCDGRVILNAWNKKWRAHQYGENWERCTFLATVEIDGRPLCNRHGGEVALAKLLGENTNV